jgi:integral membrane sensor domain MASE1
MSRSFHNWLTPNLPTPAETWQDGLRGFAIFIVYFLLVKLSYLAAAQTNAPALIWLPDGVAIGMLWLFPRRTAFVGAIAVLFANLLNATLGGMALMPAILGSVVNVLQRRCRRGACVHWVGLCKERVRG